MEDLKVQKFGSSHGKHASCTFYKAFKLTKNGKSRVITLGQFFFMKILKGIPVCIGELQLVWEDKTSSQDLASVRLYFLPECTPEGRQTHHGEDEVLAYSEKIVLKLDDLANLVVEDVSWSDGRRAHTTERLEGHEEQTDYAEAFGMNSFGLDNREVEQEAKETKETVMPDTSPSITVMSYSRYCRYRGIIKRLENCADKWMRHAVVSALGGFHTTNENNRIYFCRDLFDHADLDDFELRCDHLAPSLKGRPRKRRGSKQGSGNGNDSSEDSSCSSSFSSQQENVANKIRTGARATPLRNGFRIDKVRVSEGEQEFLIDLHKFMKSRNTPIGRIPSLGFKQIDLFQFYTLAEEIGGYEQISNKRMWKHLYDKLGGNPGFTSAATCTRRHYEKLLLPYERYRRAMYPSRRRRARVDEGTHRKIEEAKPVVKKEEVKENIKNEGEEEPRLNGHPAAVPGHIKTEVPLCNLANRNSDVSDKAVILKQEIEKMKMRKDAQNPPEKEKITSKEKMWEERRKNKFGEKVRKPGSGCQKTVRELLDQNGREYNEMNSDKVTEVKQENTENKKEVKSEIDKSDLSVHDKKVPQNLSGSVTLGEPRNSKQPLLSPLGQPHPLFYPQLLPMPGGIRGIAPMPLPFMIPHVGMPSVSHPLQAMHSSVNPAHKDSHTKSLHAFSKPVTEHKELKIHASSDLKRAIPETNTSNPRDSNNPVLSTPPTAHSQPPKPLSSPTTHAPQRPITPAHTNQLKRNYPYNDLNKTPFNTSQVMDASKSFSDPSHKRSKISHSPGSNVFSSRSGQLDIPVLDLSMKTLRAKEARQQRGESLLFNTTFSKDSKSSSKTLPYEAPQDLSVKSSSESLAFDLSSSSSRANSQKGTQLNIPHFRSHTDQKNMSFSIPVMSESHRPDSKNSSMKPELQLSTSKVSPIGLGPIPTIGGLPIDVGALVHPAFPQQLLMQGVFPTPLQLQQMIQGQVAASMLHPDYIQQSLMFPPTFTSLPSSFAPSSSSTSAKSTSSSLSSSKR